MKIQGSDKAMESLSRIIETFEAGEMSEVVRAARIAATGATSDVPSGKWSISNRLMAYLQTGGTMDCRGFKQWKLAGRKVRKGARSIFIWAPLTMKIEDKETGEDKVVVRGFRAIPVFPITATERMDQAEADGLGVDVPVEPEEAPPLAELAERLGVTMEYWPLSKSDALGWYISGADVRHIIVGTQEDGHEVWFHELGHAIHDEVLRRRGDRMSAQTTAAKEAVAQVTACVLADLYGGVDLTGNTWRYLDGYAGESEEAPTKEQKLALIASVMNDLVDVLSVIYEIEK